MQPAHRDLQGCETHCGRPALREYAGWRPPSVLRVASVRVAAFHAPSPSDGGPALASDLPGRHGSTAPARSPVGPRSDAPTPNGAARILAAPHESQIGDDTGAHRLALQSALRGPRVTGCAHAHMATPRARGQAAHPVAAGHPFRTCDGEIDISCPCAFYQPLGTAWRTRRRGVPRARGGMSVRTRAGGGRT